MRSHPRMGAFFFEVLFLVYRVREFLCFSQMEEEDEGEGGGGAEKQITQSEIFKWLPRLFGKRTKFLRKCFNSFT